jgi:hypothetical protein
MLGKMLQRGKEGDGKKLMRSSVKTEIEGES